MIAHLIELIPRANSIDSAGRSRFVGSAPALVDDQWGMDIDHIFSHTDRPHGYYGFDLTQTVEPTVRGSG